VRHSDVALLSVGSFVYSRDSRLRVQHRPADHLWSLIIDGANEADAGDYECQVNTEPQLKRRLTLKIVGERARRIVLQGSKADGIGPLIESMAFIYCPSLHFRTSSSPLGRPMGSIGFRLYTVYLVVVAFPLPPRLSLA